MALPADFAGNRSCPVMGGQVNPALFYEYKGKKIYVCCQGCIETIKADPEKYLKLAYPNG